MLLCALCSEDGNLTLWTDVEDDSGQMLPHHLAGGRIRAFDASATSTEVIMVAATDRGTIHCVHGNLSGPGKDDRMALSSRSIQMTPSAAPDLARQQVAALLCQSISSRMITCVFAFSCVPVEHQVWVHTRALRNGSTCRHMHVVVIGGLLNMICLADLQRDLDITAHSIWLVCIHDCLTCGMRMYLTVHANWLHVWWSWACCICGHMLDT